MYPINQVILGGDPLLNQSFNIEEQIKLLENQKLLLEQAKRQNQVQQPVQKLIWDDIDSEISPMTEEQKNMLFQNEKYMSIYNKLQQLVQEEILNLVKPKIESTQQGKELLTSQLKVLKEIKGKIIDSTNREMELFKKFKEYSKSNPSVTYDEFIKSNI